MVVVVAVVAVAVLAEKAEDVPQRKAKAKVQAENDVRAVLRVRPALPAKAADLLPAAKGKADVGRVLLAKGSRIVPRPHPTSSRGSNRNAPREAEVVAQAAREALVVQEAPVAVRVAAVRSSRLQARVPRHRSPSPSRARPRRCPKMP